MGPQGQQQQPQQQQHQHHKKRFKHRFHRQHQGGGGESGGGDFQPQSRPFRHSHGTPQLEIPPIDRAGLPADLQEAEVTELVATLPPPAKRTKPKPVLHQELLGKNLAESAVGRVEKSTTERAARTVSCGR
jgi:hypothetical protein